jgi:hypothetical protein
MLASEAPMAICAALASVSGASGVALAASTPLIMLTLAASVLATSVVALVAPMAICAALASLSAASVVALAAPIPTWLSADSVSLASAVALDAPTETDAADVSPSPPSGVSRLAVTPDVTVSSAAELVVLPAALVATSRYCAPLSGAVSVGVV